MNETIGSQVRRKDREKNTEPPRYRIARFEVLEPRFAIRDAQPA